MFKKIFLLITPFSSFFMFACNNIPIEKKEKLLVGKSADISELISIKQDDQIDKTKVNQKKLIQKPPMPLSKSQKIAKDYPYLSSILDDLKDDGLFVLKETYNGKIYSQENKDLNSNNNYVKIAPKKWKFGGNKEVVQLAAGDSIWMLYDLDDADGLKSDNFEDTVTFNDTSIMWGQDAQKFHEILLQSGNIQKIKDNGISVKFVQNTDDNEKGKSSFYLGSQNNHVTKTWEESMKILKREISKKYYKIILNYYQKASKIFVPIFTPKGLFTYKKVGNRAIKITFNGPSVITAAFLRITQNSKTSFYGHFSLGKEDWKAYEDPAKGYKIIAQGSKI